MMVLWERHTLTAKELGDILFLDSGTLTPLLKKMEANGLLTRRRSTEDERSLIITITDQGMALRDQAVTVPEEMKACLTIPPEESLALYRTLYRMLDREDQIPEAYRA